MMRSLEKNKSCCCYFARTERLEEYKSCNLKSNLMEEHLNPLAVTHLLQHTLRSLCIHENSQWVYAVFWRILPRNYPPPKWDGQGAYDRSRGNRRNWILVWEDGFCNFAASTTGDRMNSGSGGDCPTSSAVYGNCHEFQQYQGLQPELFFKMSHEIYNYGEGLIGKVAADHSHKLVYKEPNDQEINFLSAWHNSADSHPRTWEAQFQSGIKTIALIAVREGVVQLGAVHKVIEDLSYVVLLRKKFSYIESIPGVLLPHPSSSAFPNYKIDGYGGGTVLPADHHHHQTWQHYHHQGIGTNIAPQEFYDHHQHFNNQMLPFKNITPSMSSLEALLSKLPSVVPPHHHQQQQQQQQQQAAAAAAGGGGGYSPIQYLSTTQTHQIMDHDDDDHQLIGIMEKGVAAKEEIDEEEEEEEYRNEIGETSSSITAAAAAYRKQQFHQQQQLQDLNVSSRPSCSGFFE